MPTPVFTIGQTYTRDEIHDRVGGDKQGMLPTVGRRVVCCCTSPEIDRLAPSALLIGDFPNKYRAAKQWAGDRQAVPVFSKLKRNHWKYIGDYHVHHSTEDPLEVEAEKLRGDDSNVRIVLYLEPAGPGAALER
jgi:hypothetical protein